MWTVTLGATLGISNTLVNQSLAVLDDALAYWARYIDFGSGTLDINISFKSLGATTLAQAGTEYVSSGGAPFQAITILELQTGADQNGAVSDIDIEINSDSILAGEFFYGGVDDTIVPSGKFDLFTVLLHEIGHGLGFVSLFDISETSVFDTFISGAPGSFEFTGPIAVGVAGGNVSLTEEPSHINSSDLLAELLAPGKRTIISAIDIAILEDIGLPILQPTELSDVIYGFPTSNTVNLLGGDDLYIGVDGFQGLYEFDRISGGAGADTLIGGDGSDTLEGDEGDDSLDGALGADVLRGGDGNDTLRGYDGADELNGGAGFDIASYTGSPEAVMADLQAGTEMYGDTFISIEGLVGSSFGDTLVGDAGANRIIGGVGNDSLIGGNGQDTLLGGTGADTLNGDAEADTLDGGGAADVIFGGAGDDLLLGGLGADELRGEAGNDTINGGGGKDTLIGREGADSLLGGKGDDRLFGGDGNDTLDGGARNDFRVNGQSGDDLLFGGTGIDNLFGGLDNDTLDAGGGDDRGIGGAGD
ncbi:MAG: calcium-binding protein, partial [Alphaproteobacteria bacterium]|nr:calcium-binding protein [Alphaproteobacteria bacterium]